MEKRPTWDFTGNRKAELFGRLTGASLAASTCNDERRSTPAGRKEARNRGRREPGGARAHQKADGGGRGTSKRGKTNATLTSIRAPGSSPWTRTCAEAMRRRARGRALQVTMQTKARCRDARACTERGRERHGRRRGRARLKQNGGDACSRSTA
jgi:hypothetical protein